jgi:hypothetical protein
MSIAVSCPSCSAKFKAPDAAAGRKTKCPKCGGGIVVSNPGEPLTPTSKQSVARGKSRAGLWIGAGFGAFLLISATIAATLWATGFFARGKSESYVESHQLNPAPTEVKQVATVAAEPAKPPPAPPVITAKPDPKVEAFKQKVANYLEEARVGAKLLKMAPSLADANEKSRHITDLYTRLPDIPEGLDPTGKVDERLKNINGSFAAAAVFVKLGLDFQRLNATEEWKKIYEVQLPGVAKEVNDFASEIERLLKME